MGAGEQVDRSRPEARETDGALFISARPFRPLLHDLFPIVVLLGFGGVLIDWNTDFSEVLLNQSFVNAKCSDTYIFWRWMSTIYCIIYLVCF